MELELRATQGQWFTLERGLQYAPATTDRPNWITFLIAPSASGMTLDDARQHVRTADLQTRDALAREFAERARDVPGVKEIWFVGHHDTLVAVVTEEHDLDRDLQLEALFRIAAQAFLVPLGAQLGLYAESEGVPEAMRAGERLL